MKNKDSLAKVVVFSIFLFGSLLMIASIWMTRMVGEESGSPGYVRSTSAIPTTEGFDLTLEALPTSEHGQGGGSGQGSGGGGEGDHETVEPTITPTFNVDDWVPEEGISDDLADE